MPEIILSCKSSSTQIWPRISWLILSNGPTTRGQYAIIHCGPLYGYKPIMRRTCTTELNLKILWMYDKIYDRKYWYGIQCCENHKDASSVVSLLSSEIIPAMSTGWTSTSQMLRMTWGRRKLIITYRPLSFLSQLNFVRTPMVAIPG